MTPPTTDHFCGVFVPSHKPQRYETVFFRLLYCRNRVGGVMTPPYEMLLSSYHAFSQMSPPNGKIRRIPKKLGIRRVEYGLSP